MNPFAHTAWPNDHAAGLPRYQPIDSRGSAPSRAAMSASASSHDTRSKSPDAVRRSGCVTRSASCWTSGNAIPFGQA